MKETEPRETERETKREGRRERKEREKERDSLVCILTWTGPS